MLVVLAGVLDGLDGAVALHTGRARPLGAVVDAVADRVGDLLLVATLAVLGAPPAWCVAAGALTLLHEYLRARAGAAGMPGVGALTVAERPTRLVLVAVACLGAGTLPGGTPLTGWGWATVCAIGWVVVGAVGLVHLSVGVARTTPRQFPTTTAPEPCGAEQRTRRSGRAHEVGDDLRRQGDDRQPAARVGGAPDEDSPGTGDRFAGRQQRRPGPVRRGAVDRPAGAAVSRSRSAGVRTSRQRIRPRTSSPRARQHLQHPVGVASRRPGASQSTPAPPGRARGALTSTNHASPRPGHRRVVRARARRRSGRRRARGGRPNSASNSAS